MKPVKACGVKGSANSRSQRGSIEGTRGQKQWYIIQTIMVHRVNYVLEADIKGFDLIKLKLAVSKRDVISFAKAGEITFFILRRCKKMLQNVWRSYILYAAMAKG